MKESAVYLPLHEHDTRHEVLYFIRYDTLLENATKVYRKMRQVFYYKINTFITK